MRRPPLRLGIDTGGTFTDLVFLGRGRAGCTRCPSPPAEPLAAIAAGLKKLRPEGLDAGEVMHGSAGGARVTLPSRARIRLAEGPGTVPLFLRPGLAPGFTFEGPALLVLPGFLVPCFRYTFNK